MDKKLFFVFNPKAGKGQIREALIDIIDIFNKNGYEVIAYATQKARDAYEKTKEYESKVNPLIVVQMPNNSDAQLAEVEAWLGKNGIDTATGTLAVWLANVKENLDDISENESKQKVVIIKQAIATGWDCPRAHILVKLRKNMDEASGEAAEPTVTDDQEAHILLTRLNQIILSRLQDTAFNSEMLADEMYMSKRTLNRRVKEITNIDTASYIREFRIQAARRMLTETQLPVAEICMKCGFDSPSYFSRAFKAATDMSPSVYRKTFRGETSSKAIPE